MNAINRFSPSYHARQCAQALFQSGKIKGSDIKEVADFIGKWAERIASETERSPNFLIAHNSPISIDDLMKQWNKDCDQDGFQWIICAGHLNHKSETGSIWEAMKMLHHDLPVSIEYDYASSTVRYENVSDE